MQKKNSFKSAFYNSGPRTRSTSMKNDRSKFLGDRSTMAVYIDNVLLPKQVTDSFYATWLHCYEELFEASLSAKSPHFKFDLSASLSRKESDKIEIEKIELHGLDYERDLRGTYTKKESGTSDNVDLDENRIGELKQDCLVKETCARALQSNNNNKSTYSATKLFSGRKKCYKVNHDDNL